MGKRGGEEARNKNRPIKKQIKKTTTLVSADEPCYDGYIFMCNAQTKSDCFKYKLFGLPPSKIDVLHNIIHPHMKLFLFDFDVRLLYGIFTPASMPQLSIQPSAFSGRFSAQVRFQISEDCLPLPESVFKPAIRDNYQGSKFRQELTKEHVQNLLSLFRPVAMSTSQDVVRLPAAIALEQSRKPPGFYLSSEPGALPAVRAQAQLQSYYSKKATPTYFPPLPEHESHNRYVALPRDDQVSLVERNIIAQAHRKLPSQSSHTGNLSTKSLSAAYWISVANESLQKEMYAPSGQGITLANTGMAVSSESLQKEMYAPTHQSIPLANTGTEVSSESLQKNTYTPSRQSMSLANTGMTASSQTPPSIMEKETPIIFQHPPTPSNNSSLATATSVVVQVQPPTEDCPSHQPTPLVPGQWTQYPNPVHSAPSQWQQVANADNAPTLVVQNGSASGSHSIPETVANQYISSTVTPLDYYNYYGTRTGIDGIPVQAHDSGAYYSDTNNVAAQVIDPAAAYYSTNSSVPAQDGNLAAYYSVNTGVIAQAGDVSGGYYLGTTTHDQAAAYYHPSTGIPAQSHDLAEYYAATTGIPGQTHPQGGYYFPENSYGHYTQAPVSLQPPAYWDPNMVVAQYPQQQTLPSTNGGGEHTMALAGAAAATIYPVAGL